jgi:sn-glycerol 3-phosphate transport system permease protein
MTRTIGSRPFNAAPYMYLLPAFAIFGVFTFYPFVRTVFISLFLTNLHGKPVEFVGFQNYVDSFMSPAFRESLGVSFRYIPMIALPPIVIGLVLALIADSITAGKRVYEIIFALPMAIAAAPTAIIFRMLYHPSSGLLNYLFGLKINWLNDRHYALTALAIAAVWAGLGRDFLFLYAAVKNVPKELLECAMLDGAPYRTKFFRIILPHVSPQIFFVIILGTIGSFQSFALVRMLTQGGPGSSTTVVIMSIYNAAFQNNAFDMACAQSLILFCIMLVITLIQFSFEKKGVFYQ